MSPCSTDSYETFSTSNTSTALENTGIKELQTINSNNYPCATSEIQVIDLVNAHRVSIDLNSLIKNNCISLNTEEHTNYMLRIDTLSHDSLNVRSQDII
jgi:uncharacterized protein YkwD